MNNRNTMEDNFLKLEKYLAEKKEIIDQRLDKFVQSRGPTKIWESMKYSLMAGGKRLRPVLSLAAAEILGCDIEKVIPVACAIEMIHTQSLIHDDLPSLDNDDLRRGKPTNHVVYGEALAIIAGDALFAYAFNLIVKETPVSVSRENLARVIQEISHAAGADGMCGGQALDISIEKKTEVDDAILQFIHTHKTGAIIRAAVRSAAILAGADEEQLFSLTLYAENIGLAFQIVDDVLDVTGKTEQLGKKAGKDQNKATYPRLYGIRESMNIAENHVKLAIKNLEIFGEKAEYLKLLAEYTLNRRN
jgi:geranylgeranyl diphosphate synthase type II